MIVAGTLRKVYDQMPEPRYVIWMGSCRSIFMCPVVCFCCKRRSAALPRLSADPAKVFCSLIGGTSRIGAGVEGKALWSR